MEGYHYKIIRIDEKDRWIFLNADEWDYEEPDSFACLVKKIRDNLNGKIIDKGMTSYSIDNDPFRLTYQWDDAFGITVVYPPDVEKNDVVAFLEKYF